MRNVLDKLPNSAREEVKAWLGSVRDAPTPEVGRQAAAEMIAHFEGQYPAAMKSFADDVDASLAHLRVPVAHRRYVRTTKLIERSFVEERRLTKVIPRFFTERSCLRCSCQTTLTAYSGLDSPVLRRSVRALPVTRPDRRADVATSSGFTGQGIFGIVWALSSPVAQW